MSTLGDSPASGLYWPTFQNPLSGPSSKALKMDLTEGSETSANINQTPANHLKVDILNTEHGESLKSRSRTT
jgi:hypothetical protein